MIALDRLETLARMEEVAPDWARLCSECPHATVFQSPDWLIPWWRHVPQGDLCLLTFRDAKKLVGIAPCVVKRNRLSLMGEGASDYLDIVVESSFSSPVVAALEKHIAAQRMLVDKCQHIRPESLWLRIGTPDGYVAQVFEDEPTAVLNLPAHCAGLEDAIPRSILKKVEYYRRRLTRAGEWGISIANEDTMPELFDALIRNHQSRRALRGEVGAFSDDPVRSFHREAAARSLARGTLRLFGLRFAGTIAASLYAFNSQRRVYYYASGFDPQFSKFDLGTILIAAAIELSIREHADVFDFLRGTEEYKYRWGASTQPLVRRELIGAAEPMPMSPGDNQQTKEAAIWGVHPD